MKEMTAKRFLECLDYLRISQRSLAPMLGCSARLPYLWGEGDQSVPPAIADWLEAWVKLRTKAPDPPPPVYWRRNGGWEDLPRRRPAPRAIQPPAKPAKRQHA